MPAKKAAEKKAAPKEEAAAAPDTSQPTKLQFTQDGRIIPPPEFGGAVVAPAAEEPAPAIIDRSAEPAPPQEVLDPSSYDHKTWAADATREEETTESGAADHAEGEEE